MKMKYIGIRTALLCLSLGLMAFACDGWQYRQERGHRRVLVAENEVHDGWFFGGGDQVVVEGTINGDAYVAGGTVEIDGTINGDLIAAGGMVIVNGKVTDHVRAAGGTLWIDGEVGKDVTIAGGNIRIGRKATIAGGMLAAGGNLDISGTVSKEARLAAGEADILGTVKGDVQFTGDRLSISNGGHVGGSLSAYVKNKELVNLAEGAVAGKVDITQKQPEKRAEILGLPAWRFWCKLFWFLAVAFVGLIVVLVAPNQLKKMGSTITARLGDTVIWGILALIVIPIVAAILIATLIGIPAAILLLTIYCWMVYLSQLALPIVTAGMIFMLEGKGRLPLFGALAVGLVIVEIVTLIPFVGVLVCLAGSVLGTGSILLIGQEEWKKR